MGTESVNGGTYTFMVFFFFYLLENTVQWQYSKCKCNKFEYKGAFFEVYFSSRWNKMDQRACICWKCFSLCGPGCWINRPSPLLYSSMLKKIPKHPFLPQTLWNKPKVRLMLFLLLKEIKSHQKFIGQSNKTTQ